MIASGSSLPALALLLLGWCSGTRTHQGGQSIFSREAENDPLSRRSVTCLQVEALQIVLDVSQVALPQRTPAGNALE